MATATIEQPLSVRKPSKSTNSQTDQKLAEAPATARDSALKLMRKPFEPHQVSTMCKSTKRDNPLGRCNACGGWHKLPAVQLSYVGHAALTDRLLDVDPEWTWKPLAYAPNGTPLLDGDGGMWIELTVAGVTRLGYGDAQGKTGGDAMKERIGDALRNAAMRFGAALDLWHKGNLHIAEEPKEEAVDDSQNIADAAPQYPPRPPVAPDKPSVPVGSILPFQKTAFLQAAKKANKTNAEVLAYLGTLGCESLDEMPKKDFQQALKWAME